MTIYDLKLYGVHMPRLIGGSKVLLSKDRAEVYEKAPREYRFEVTALKQYGTKQDVLWLQFVDGHPEYITLHDPVMYLEDGEWKPAKNKEVVDAFWSKYNELAELEAIDGNISIFDLTFYGFQEDIGCGINKVEITLTRSSRDRRRTANSLLFTATILKEYKANKYVVKAVTVAGKICYIPLFNANMYYDDENRKWAYCCNKSSIPEKILKCYVKYLNG